MREYVTKIWPGNALGEAFARTFPFVWLGVSVENQHWADVRIPVLLDTPAAVRFLSCEPLLGPLELTDIRHRTPTGHECSIDALRNEEPLFRRESIDVNRIDWVIAGGESAGPAKRALVERCECGSTRHYPIAGCEDCAGTGWRPKPEALEWVRSLRDQCVAAGVPFFFKQWGGPRPKSGGWLLDGRTWDEFPSSEHDGFGAGSGVLRQPKGGGAQ